MPKPRQSQASSQKGHRRCLDFSLAQTLLTTVTGKTDGERMVTGAGLKALSHERGVPGVKDVPGMKTRRLTAEQGIIDLVDPAARVEMGDRIEMWAHYPAATTHLHKRMYGIRGGRVEEVPRVDG